MSERFVLDVTRPADRLLVAGLVDLRSTFADLRGHVMLVGGLMARSWLLLRPTEDIPPRATADIDLGIDRRGLGLTANTERVGPLLEAKDFRPLPGEEGFRFEKRFGDASLLVDVFVAKGASREEPPVLEKGITTLAAPGLAYALSRGPVFAEAMFVDGQRSNEIELPLPTLDAAFVLKGALASSGVRARADRVERDRIDTVMLAAACANDEQAVRALAVAIHREAKQAMKWLEEKLDDAGSPVARTLERHMSEQFGIEGGHEWAVDVARHLLARVRAAGPAANDLKG